jgi:non-specific serine/threonine protein kinase
MQKFAFMTDISAPTPATAEPPLVHLDALPVGTRLAEFEVQSLLGVGGFGMVYRAYDHSLHRTVAIKEYMPSALASRQDGLVLSIRSSADKSTYDSGLRSFVAEARLLAQFDHPSLVKVYRFWEANNTAYMVMPLYSGVTLKQARSQMAAPPSEAWLRTVLWSILQALRVLHKNKTLHRDVSPDNIFLQDMGPPVLLDLGAARRAISDKSHQLTAILKVNYAPIEQYAEAEDLQQGPWTDLYSLAAVVYTCLRNDPPLPATSRVVRDRLPTLASVVKTVQEHLGQSYSEKFVSAVSHALAVQPADRPQSVQEFIDEMTLEVVEDLARFDWRAGMGAQLLSAADDVSRSQWVTQSQTIPAGRESAHGGAGVDQDVTLAPAPRHTGKSTRKSRKMIVWPVAILMMTAVLGFWIIRANDVVGGAPLVVAPEPAAAPVVAGPASMASEPQDIASLPVIPTPPTVIYGSAASPVPAHPVSPEGKVKAASAERKKTRTDTSKTADTKTAQPVRKPAQGKTARPTSLDQCAEKSFLLRLWCVHSECQKAENASLPVCIEDRERNTRPN